MEDLHTAPINGFTSLPPINKKGRAPKIVFPTRVDDTIVAPQDVNLHASVCVWRLPASALASGSAPSWLMKLQPMPWV